MSLPTSPFDATKSIFAGLSVISFTPTGGTAIVFESKLLSHKLAQEEKSLERPDATGVLRTVRTIVTKCEESFTFELDEVKRLLDLFGNALCGSKSGVCTLYMPDPADTGGTVSLKSEAGFACMVTRDGDLNFGNSEFSKATIKITSNKSGAITWTSGATS